MSISFCLYICYLYAALLVTCDIILLLAPEKILLVIEFPQLVVECSHGEKVGLQYNGFQKAVILIQAFTWIPHGFYKQCPELEIRKSLSTYPLADF